MSSISRRRELSPRNSKLRMDRKPTHTKITDPSLPAGKRKEIDNVMKKARALPNDYWDKKLIEAEEKDPNRWRHTGYKKLYIEGDNGSLENERVLIGTSGGDSYRYSNQHAMRKSRSRSRNRRTPPSPGRRSQELRRRSPKSTYIPKRISRSPDKKRRSPDVRRKPRSPQQIPMRRKSPRLPRSPVEIRRRSPPPPPPQIPREGMSTKRRSSPQNLPKHMAQQRFYNPRTKRPPSPPTPKGTRSPSLSSCSEESCSACSEDCHIRSRSRSLSITHVRSNRVPRSPIPIKSPSGNNRIPNNQSKPRLQNEGTGVISTSSSSRIRHVSPSMQRIDVRQKVAVVKHRIEKVIPEKNNKSIDRRIPPTIESNLQSQQIKDISPKSHHSLKHRCPVVEDFPKSLKRPFPPPEPQDTTAKKQIEKSSDKLRARIKIEGEKTRRPKSPSSASDESSSSEGSLPTFSATTRLTLSERFGKMAQWSVDRSNMENMRITKNSSGGELKVMISEGIESPPRRYSYSPAPAGHFPEELMTQGPSGLSSWDDVRVRYEYYKGRGYLRDLDLQDYVKWEEWWYRYQEWLKQERFYEMWERTQMNRRRNKKKVPISQRLN